MVLRSSAGARFLYVALLDKRSQKFHGLVFAEPVVRDNLPARRRAFFLDESIYQFLIAGQSGPRVGHGKRDSHGVFAYVEFGFLLVFSKVDKISAAAVAKIEAAGGKVEQSC